MRTIVVLGFGAVLLSSGIAQAAHRDHAAQTARGFQTVPPIRGPRGPVQLRLLTMADGHAADPRGHQTLASWMPQETNALQVAGLGKTRLRVTQSPTLWDPTPQNRGANYETPGLHTKIAYRSDAGTEDELLVQIPVSFHHHLPGDQFADSNTYTLELRTHVGTADETTHRLSGIASAGRITPVALKGDLGHAFHLTMWPQGSAGLGGYLNGRTVSGVRE